VNSPAQYAPILVGTFDPAFAAAGSKEMEMCRKPKGVSFRPGQRRSWMLDNAKHALYYPVSDEKMVRGEGIYLYDEDGKRYIDCAAGTFNLSLGYSHPAVVAAITEQSRLAIHISSSFQTDQINALVQKLLEVSPANITKVHPKVCSGSTANEGAIKMAQYATGRSEIVSMFRSHLGQTMMTSSLSGNAFRRQPFPVRFPGQLIVPDPYCFRCFYRETPDTCGRLCVDRINDFIEYASAGQVAAILVEPISGNGGNIVPPAGYFQKLRQLCDEHEILLIFDEIQTGIGRTGYMFAAEYFGVEPDCITVAKGLGGSGAQIAAILTSDKMAGLPSHHHSFTYGANLLAAAAANVTIDIIRQPAFLENVRSVGRYILERLLDAQRRHREIVDVRGVGLMIGIELADRNGRPAVSLTNELSARAKQYGFLLRTSRYGFGNVLKMRPPLIITMQEAEDVCDRLELLFKAELG
jgi:4-aminobutyrate aminotransferase